jgi:uncharacterized membrane protein
MAFCPNCGTEASGAYCPNCGTQMGGAAGSASTGSASAGSASGYSSQTGYSSASGATVPRSGGLSQNAASALCYLLGFITGIIFLVLAPYNQDRTVRFHAWQSIFLNIIFIALSIILPAVGHLAGMALLSIVDLAGFVLWLYLLFSVFNGKQVRLPLIADWADKQANR